MPEDYWYDVSDIIESGECDMLGSAEPEDRDVISVTIQQPQPEEEKEAQTVGGVEEEGIPEEYVVVDEVGRCDSEDSENKEEEKYMDEFRT